jgi:hypothetical protein
MGMMKSEYRRSETDCLASPALRRSTSGLPVRTKPSEGRSHYIALHFVKYALATLIQGVALALRH